MERSVLNTKSIRNLVDENEVVTLVADWSDGNDEVTQMLEALGDKQLPVIAIFPADDPYRPTKLTGLYSKSDLTRAIRSAGASASVDKPGKTKFVSQSP